MADNTTEAVERIAEALNAIRLFAHDSIEHDGDARATLANLHGIRDTVDNLRGEVDFRALSYQSRALLSERTALLERGEEEAYEIGRRDGCEEAVADLDRATGGDGEYFASTEPGEGCPDPEAMKARIVQRLQATNTRAHAAETKLATLTEAVSDASVLKTHADGSVTLDFPAEAARAIYAAIGVEVQS